MSIDPQLFRLESDPERRINGQTYRDGWTQIATRGMVLDLLRMVPTKDLGRDQLATWLALEIRAAVLAHESANLAAIARKMGITRAKARRLLPLAAELVTGHSPATDRPPTGHTPAVFEQAKPDNRKKAATDRPPTGHAPATDRPPDSGSSPSRTGSNAIHHTADSRQQTADTQLPLGAPRSRPAPKPKPGLSMSAAEVEQLKRASEILTEAKVIRSPLVAGGSLSSHGETILKACRRDAVEVAHMPTVAEALVGGPLQWLRDGSRSTIATLTRKSNRQGEAFAGYVREARMWHDERGGVEQPAIPPHLARRLASLDGVDLAQLDRCQTARHVRALIPGLDPDLAMEVLQDTRAARDRGGWVAIANRAR